MVTPSLREVANLVQTRLPRELCHEVYAYLWDGATLGRLDYRSHLHSRSRFLSRGVCKSIHDQAGNPICMCNTPAKIPVFARAVFVGFRFAHEAVTWLYDSSKSFTLNAASEIYVFFVTDVFHIGLQPAMFRLRRLVLDLDLLSAQLAKDITHLDRHALCLLKFKFHPDFRLVIALTMSCPEPNTSHARALMTTANAFEPIVTLIEETNRAKVAYCYRDRQYGTVDIKHLLSCKNDQEWLNLMRGRV